MNTAKNIVQIRKIIGQNRVNLKKGTLLVTTLKSYIVLCCLTNLISTYELEALISALIKT